MVSMARRSPRTGEIAGSNPAYSIVLVSWCSGLTRRPVKAEIAGSNPVETVGSHVGNAFVTFRWQVRSSPLGLSAT